MKVGAHRSMFLPLCHRGLVVGAASAGQKPRAIQPFAAVLPDLPGPAVERRTKTEENQIVQKAVWTILPISPPRFPRPKRRCLPSASRTRRRRRAWTVRTAARRARQARGAARPAGADRSRIASRRHCVPMTCRYPVPYVPSTTANYCWTNESHPSAGGPCCAWSSRWTQKTTSPAAGYDGAARRIVSPLRPDFLLSIDYHKVFFFATAEVWTIENCRCA